MTRANYFYFDTTKVFLTVVTFALVLCLMSCGDKQRSNSALVDPWQEPVDMPINNGFENSETKTIQEPNLAQESDTMFPPEDLPEKTHYLSGVVLVRTMYYYKMSFGDVLDVFFSEVDEDGTPVNPVASCNDVVPKVAFGTGFFVNAEGLIATNSHVANPSVDAKKVRSSFLLSLSSYGSNIQGDVNELNTFIGYLLYEISNAEATEVSETGENYIKDLIDERNQKQNIVNAITLLQGQDCDVTCEAKVGIAFNNTYVTESSDFLPCVLKKEDKDNDLALIQLKHKGKEVPSGCHFFEVPTEEGGYSSSNTTKVGSELTMIAYNMGLTLASIEDGIMAQITSGKITQNQVKTIMYDISSLPGSSGAPVIDEWGNLVAVNFAGISTTQGFNYGIKAYLLRRLLDKD